MLTLADRREIDDLFIRYSNMIDERRFSRIGEVFTEDGVFDLTAYDNGEHHGHAAIAETIRSSANPLIHIAVNIELNPETPDRVHSLARCLAVRVTEPTTVATYRDILVRTPAGWRIARRAVSRHSADVVPAES